jgi:histone demethylase
MASAPQPAPNKPRSLPSVEEAWNLPISNEMTNRQAQPRQGMTRTGQPVKKEEGAPPAQPQQRPPFYLTQTQLQTLQYLQTQPSLLPQQQQLLHQLQNQFRMMQQHQQQLRLQAQQQQAAAGIPRPVQPQGQFSGQAPPAQAAASSGAELDGLNVSDKELESLLSQQDIGSFAENLLKQFQEMAGDSGEENKDGGDTKPDAAVLASALAKAVGENKAKTEADKAADLMETMDIDHLDIPTSVEIVQQETYHPPELNITMTAEEILEACGKAISKKGRISHSILPEDQPPPGPPERPSITLTKEQLLPPTPSVYLENKKDAFSPQLQEFCLQHPITVVRGIAAALKLDLGLFATKNLLETQPEHPVKVRTQLKQGSDENWDPAVSQQVWRCSSVESTTTIGGYAKYQVTAFQEAFQLEHEKTTSHRSDEEINGRKKKKNIPTLKHGYCVDLSLEHKFRQQLQVKQ